MIYVFDNGPLIQLFRYYYRERFPTLWQSFDKLVQSGQIVSVREVYNELKDHDDDLKAWADEHSHLFTVPTPDELAFVAEILRNPHYQLLIEIKKRMSPRPVADPFVISRAKIIDGIVVTSEKKKPNAPKIPTVCEELGVGCLNLEEFMEREGWKF